MDNTNVNSTTDDILTVKEKSPFSFVGKIFGVLIIVISLLFLYIVLNKQPQETIDINQQESEVTGVIENGVQEHVQEQKFNF